MSLVYTLSISNCGILGIVHAATDQLLRSELESSLFRSSAIPGILSADQDGDEKSSGHGN